MVTPLQAWREGLGLPDCKGNHLERVKVFGCSAFAYLYERRKLGNRAEHCIYLGVDPTKKGFRVYSIARKVILVRRDVVFDEDSFPLKTQVPTRPTLRTHTHDTTYVYDSSDSDADNSVASVSPPLGRFYDRTEESTPPSLSPVTPSHVECDSPPGEDAMHQGEAVELDYSTPSRLIVHLPKPRQPLLASQESKVDTDPNRFSTTPFTVRMERDFPGIDDSLSPVPLRRSTRSRQLSGKALDNVANLSTVALVPKTRREALKSPQAKSC